MSALQISNLIAFIACFGSFTWAMKYHFRIVDKMPLAARGIQIIGGTFLLAHLLALLQPLGAHWATAVGTLLLYSLSFVLFWSCVRLNQAKPLSAAFSVDKPEHLMARGPYRFVRHPFYLSYSLGWIAGIIASGRPWLLVSLVVMGTIYYRAAAAEERKFASSNLAAAYDRYRQSTGMFLPRIWPKAAAWERNKSV